MAIRMLCVNEITTVTENFSATAVCVDPAHTPVVGPGTQCSSVFYNVALNPPVLTFSFDAQFEYQYLNQGCTFMDFCDVFGMSGTIDIAADGLTSCCGVTPSVSFISCTCDPLSITTTPTSVAGVIGTTFTITNLCVPTIICVDDTTCPG